MKQCFGGKDSSKAALLSVVYSLMYCIYASTHSQLHTSLYTIALRLAYSGNNKMGTAIIISVAQEV